MYRITLTLEGMCFNEPGVSTVSCVAGRFIGRRVSETMGVPLRWESAVVSPPIPEGGEIISMGGIGFSLLNGTPTRLG